MKHMCDEVSRGLAFNLEEVARCQPAEQRLMAGEIAVAETRLAFLRACTDSNRGKLQDWHPSLPAYFIPGRPG